MLESNVVIGIAITATASLFFATGATLQHYAIGGIVDTDSDNKSMGAGQLWRMVKTPLWLLGLAIITVGAIGHLYGLTFAPVTVVQPVGILAVPWSVLMAAKLHKHKVTARMWQAVLLTFVGIVGFTAISATHAAHEKQADPAVVLGGAIAVWIIGFCFAFLGWRGKSALWRSLFWATGGSFFYGLTSALFKSLHNLQRIDGFMFHSPTFFVLALMWVASYGLGGVMIQQGYATGPAEVVVGSMDTTDPIVAVGYGLIVLGEGALLGVQQSLGMVFFAVVAIGGVVWLSRNHPDAAKAAPAGP